MRVKRYETELSAKGKLPLLKEVESVKYGEGRLYFGSPDQISEMLNECFRLAYKTEESMYLCCYTTKLTLIGVFEVSHGVVNASLVGIREVFLKVLLSGASRFVLAHNHPSGDVTPSKEDLEIAKKMSKAAHLMGVQFCDFLILGVLDTDIASKEIYYSLKENQPSLLN